MQRRIAACAAAVLAALTALAGLWSTANAQADEYRFEAVSSEVPPGQGVRIAVRLLDPDGQPVSASSVTITSSRLDMGPDGMATMEAPLTPIETDEPGVLAFNTELVMAGRWALTIEAEVEGVPEPVKGTVVYTAAEQEADAAPAANAAGEREILYYRNPMGLPDVSPVPKKDSMGMDYIPVYADELSGEPGTVRINTAKVQRAGVRTAPVQTMDLARKVRGAGMVAADESRLAAVTAKFSGFIERLHIRTTGETVGVGEPLLSVWVEDEELIRKMIDLAAMARTGAPAEQEKRNLRIFDVPEADIERIASGDASLRTITFNAPVAGTVLEKPAMDGMRFDAGDTLFHVADLSTVWVIADIPEQDLALVRPGQTARLSLPSMPGNTLEGVVDFIYPELDTEARSGRARIVVPNADGRLRLGMFVHADIDAPVGEGPALAVPASAVIDDGERQVVFVAKGDGVFEPRDIVAGPRAGSFIAVRDGLAAGEVVVSEGVFLIDAESNLQAALSAFTPDPGTR